MERLIARELMDDDETVGTSAEWRDSLGDLAKVNAYLGGWNALRAELDRLRTYPRKVLDVATGGADLPKRLLDYLKTRGVEATCIALDQSARIVGLAEELVGPRRDLTFVTGDARRLHFADHSFDLAMMNLTLHHFDPEDGIAALRELARVGAVVIVNDLRRSRIAWAFAKFVFPLFTRNRFTRNDGPLSVLRAYTPLEARDLARRAGWSSVAVRKYFGYRMTLVGGTTCM